MAKKLKFPLKCVGIPKTVDNDLPYTDCSPGFGSVAKYIATSTLEAGLDVKSMAETSTKVSFWKSWEDMQDGLLQHPV